MSDELGKYNSANDPFADPFADVEPNDDESVRLTDIIDISSLQKRKELGSFNFEGYRPKKHQAVLHHDFYRREWVSNTIWVCPRRWGKTIFCILEILMQALSKAWRTNLPFLKYGHIFPDLTNAKKVVWEDWVYYSQSLPWVHVNSNTATITFVVYNKAGRRVKVIIDVLGLKNIQNKRGILYDGVVLDERSLYPPNFRTVILPMVGDETRQPTFVKSVGTPIEETDFWEEFDKFKRYEDAGNLLFHTFWTSYKKSRHITEDKYLEFKSIMSPEAFAIEFECQRGVKTGASYFGYFLEQVVSRGGVRDIESDPSIFKTVVCDIGGTTAKSRDLFALWYFQYNPNLGMFDILEYDELSGVSEQSLYTTIQDTNYNIGQVILPWDAASGLRSTASVFRELFPQARVDVLVRTSKLNGIREARNFFSKVNFNEYKTVIGRQCLKRYSKQFDIRKGIYLTSPAHDRYSHGADAFMYAALAHKRQILLAKGQGGIYPKKMVYSESYNPHRGYGSDIATIF